MDRFQLVSDYRPSGDQPEAITGLVNGVNWGLREQTLLGVTGSGKTFTMASVIEKLNRPTLVLAHNKTLAAQLCSEFREFFPNNAVEYFISYYDYYQPEAYIAHTDTYIEKDASVNEEIDRLRHSATSALFERRDVIVVSSVSCLYGLGDPIDYKSMVISLRVGNEYPLDSVLKKLTEIRYERNDLDFSRNKFRLRGDTLEIYPAYWSGRAIRVEFFLGRHIVAGGIDGHMIQKTLGNAGNGVDLTDAVYLIPEKFHADGLACPIGGIYFQSIATKTEFITGKVQVVALIADLRQFSQHIIQRIFVANPERNHHALIVDGVTQSVEAADGRHHDHVTALKQCGGGAVAQTIDFLIDGGILLDIGIRMGNVGFRLVIVVIGNEIFHRIVGEELPELCTKLSCQGLVVGQHQSWPVQLLNDGSHGKGLAGASNTQKGLLPQSPVDTVNQTFNGLRLVAGRVVFRNEFEFVHKKPPYGSK